MKAAKGSQHGSNPMNVAGRRVVMDGMRFGQAATTPGGGSVTEHEAQYLKNPCTNGPRGDAKTSR